MVADRTPVLVGIGVATQREDDPAYALDPLALMLKATRLAGEDSGAPGLLPALDRILVPKGRWHYGDPGRRIAASVGAVRADTVVSTVGVLQQTLIGMACAAIAEGEIDVAMVVGGDAGFCILRAPITGQSLHEPGDADGTPDLLLSPKAELRHPAELRAGLRMPVGLYAIMESAFRARRGWSVDAHRDRVAALYSRFSEIAAHNPAAWTRQAMPPEAILSRDLTVTGGMSFAGGPYNNYVLQSTARRGQKLRAAGKAIGLVSSVSGTLTKQGFGLWSTTVAPGPFRFTDVTGAVADAVSVKPVVMDYVGSGVVAGYSVLHDKSGPPRSIVVADVDGGCRTVAASTDPAVAARMQAAECCGAPIVLDKDRFRLAT
jgi:hypothetical protein